MYDPRKYPDFEYVYKSDNQYVIYPTFTNPDAEKRHGAKDLKEHLPRMDTTNFVYPITSSHYRNRVLFEDSSSNSTEIYTIEVKNHLQQL